MQQTAERLDQVRMHLQNALEELAGDDSADATAIRRELTATQRHVNRIRRRQAAEWADRFLHPSRLP